MPETKRRRAGSSANAIHKPKPNISRPRRTSTAKQGRFSRGWTFRTKPEPTGAKRVLGALTGSRKRGAAAAGGLALLAGGLAALRQRRGGVETSPSTAQPAAHDGPGTC
jgi:hypothetical protein